MFFGSLRWFENCLIWFDVVCLLLVEVVLFHEHTQTRIHEHISNMESNIIRRLVVLGAITIMGIIGIQSYWVMRTWDMKEQEFSQTVKIALLKVAQSLENLSGRNNLPSKGLITQQSSNTYIVNINDEINADMLEYYLQKELEERGLADDFMYGIYDLSLIHI